MSGKTYGITRQTADALATVRAAIEAGHLPVDPMAAVILKDVEDATREFARNAAIVRIRLINHPPPQPKRGRAYIGPVMARSDAARVAGRGAQWTDDDMDLLAKLWRDGSLTTQDIAERIGRSRSACRDKAIRLGLTKEGERPHPPPVCRAGEAHENGHTKRPLLLAVRRLHERRTADAERLRGFA